MPDSNLTAAQREAYAVARANDPTLHTVQISHATAGDVYLVRDKKPLTATLEDLSTEVDFEAVAFRLDVPRSGESGQSQWTLSIDNVDQRITDYVNAIKNSQLETTVSYRPYLASDLTQPQVSSPISLTAVEINLGAVEVTIHCKFVDVVNRPFPNENYTRERFPSLGN